MNKRSKLVIQYLVLTALLIFTIALGVNNYNAGVYADTHQLSGAEVGWFAPIGVPLLGLFVLITFGYGVYLITHLFEKTKSS